MQDSSFLCKKLTFFERKKKKKQFLQTFFKVCTFGILYDKEISYIIANCAVW